MTNEAKRFKQMERVFTAVLIAAAILFIIYLIAAAVSSRGISRG